MDHKNKGVDAALEFVSNYFDGAPGFALLAAFDAGEQQRPEWLGFRPGAEAQAVRAFLERHWGQRNLYYGVNTGAQRPQRKLTDDDVAYVLAFAADADVKSGDAMPQQWHDDRRAELLAWLREHGEYTYLVDSGGGAQTLVKLAQPMACDAGTRDSYRARGKAAIDRLRAATAAMPWLEWDSVFDPSRIMRLPGTPNLPTARKRERGRTETRLAAVVDAKASRRIAWQPEAVAAGAPPRDDLVAFTAEVAAQRLRELGIKENVVRLALEDKGLNAKGDRSADIFKVELALARKRVPAGEAVGLLLALPLTVGAKAREWGEKALRRDYAKAVARCRGYALGERREIELHNGQQPQALRAVTKALIDSPQLEVVVYARALTQPYVVERRNISGQPVASLELNTLGAEVLASLLNEVALFMKYDGRAATMVPTDCPVELARVYRGRPVLWEGLRRVDRLAQTPLYVDGQLYSEPGYCESQCAYIQAPAGIALPATLDRTAAETAMARVTAWLDEFRFETDMHRSVAVCLLFAAAMRASLPHAKGFLIDKPEFGAGASTLTDLAHIVLTGRRAAPVSWAYKADEMEKRMDAVQLAAAPALIIDNMPQGGTLQHETLAVILTQQEREPRILGKSEMRKLPNTQLVVVNGVNVGVSKDLVRRILPCRLNPNMENAHRREYRRPALLEDAQRDRAALLADIYAVVAWYDRHVRAGGKRAACVHDAGYVDFVRLCAEPLVALGLPDPMRAAEGLEVVDEERQALANVLHTWHEVLGTEAMPLANAMVPRSDGGHRMRSALFEARGIDEKVGEDSARRMIGKYLAKNKDRVVDGYKLVQQTHREGVVAWRVVRADGGAETQGTGGPPVEF